MSHGLHRFVVHQNKMTKNDWVIRQYLLSSSDVRSPLMRYVNFHFARGRGTSLREGCDESEETFPSFPSSDCEMSLITLQVLEGAHCGPSFFYTSSALRSHKCKYKLGVVNLNSNVK